MALEIYSTAQVGRAIKNVCALDENFTNVMVLTDKQLDDFQPPPTGNSPLKIQPCTFRVFAAR